MGRDLSENIETCANATGYSSSTAVGPTAIRETYESEGPNLTTAASMTPPPDLKDASTLFMDASYEPEVVPVKDVVEMVPGMYRILDLVSDTDSSGLSMGEYITPWSWSYIY